MPAGRHWPQARVRQYSIRGRGSRRQLVQPAFWLVGGGRAAMAEMRRSGVIMEFEVAAEHLQQMLLKTHHQRMHPAVEDHIGAFVAHLRRVARGEVLHMHRA
jgi:hypothetical protein